jgi:hypothetical protein
MAVVYLRLAIAMVDLDRRILSVLILHIFTALYAGDKLTLNAAFAADCHADRHNMIALGPKQSLIFPMSFILMSPFEFAKFDAESAATIIRRAGLR